MLRDSGSMGQPAAHGYDGVNPPGSGPKFPAGPKDIFSPSDDGGRSTRSKPSNMPLRVRYGLPGGHFNGSPKKLGAPSKNDAAMRRKGKKNVKPSLVEVYRRDDGWAVFYFFPPSAEISEKDQ